MAACRVLIVEDDPRVSAHLESIVEQLMDADIIVGASIAEANAALALDIDYALLDVDVLDGTTYAFAETLASAGILFAFLSASNREQVPEGLKDAPFVAKPYTEGDIRELLRQAGKLL